MADMTMRIEASPELERMLRRVVQGAVQQVRAGRGQEGKSLYPVTIQAPDGKRFMMVDEIGESHFMPEGGIRAGEARGWRQAFTLSPRHPDPSEVPPDHKARARSFDRATEAGAREALLAVKEDLDSWVAQCIVEDEANGRRDRETDPERYSLLPADVRTIVTDVARELGVAL